MMQLNYDGTSGVNQKSIYYWLIVKKTIKKENDLFYLNVYIFIEIGNKVTVT